MSLLAVNVGDEGGFAPNVGGAEESLELISEAIKGAGYEGKIKIALDVASSEFYKDGKYDLDFKNPNSDPQKWISGTELADLYLKYVDKYPIVSIEDPFDQDDWEAWSHFTKRSKLQIVGDDLTVTNPLRIKTAIQKKACNGLLLKVGGSVAQTARSIADCLLQIRLIRSVPFPSPFRRTLQLSCCIPCMFILFLVHNLPSLTDGVSWSLTAVAKPKTPSLLTLLLPWVLVRSRLAHRREASVLPNITHCCASSKFGRPLCLHCIQLAFQG